VEIAPLEMLLVTKLCKARYFPNTSLFDSRIGHNPSYTWLDIWKACHILMNKCSWIIGSNTNINVMSDRGCERKKELGYIHLKCKVHIILVLMNLCYRMWKNGIRKKSSLNFLWMVLTVFLISHCLIWLRKIS
jgi:hypothetical protein